MLVKCFLDVLHIFKNFLLFSIFLHFLNFQLFPLQKPLSHKNVPTPQSIKRNLTSLLKLSMKRNVAQSIKRNLNTPSSWTLQWNGTLPSTRVQSNGTLPFLSPGASFTVRNQSNGTLVRPRKTSGISDSERCPTTRLQTHWNVTKKETVVVGWRRRFPTGMSLWNEAATRRQRKLTRFWVVDWGGACLVALILSLFE